MSFEDDMIEDGFNNESDYLDFLCYEADNKYFEYEKEVPSQEEIDYLEEQEKERIQERKELHLKYNKKRINNELILKQWIINNPEKAVIWFAHYSQSTDTNSDSLLAFIDILGTDNNYTEDYFISKYTFQPYSDINTNDPYHKYLNSVYFNWKTWLEEYEEYKEFENKAPDDLQLLISSINASYVKEAIGYNGHNIDKNYTNDIKTYHAYEILKKWIKDNKLEWDQILINFNKPKKEENIYLFQAWLDNFSTTIEAFDVWRIKKTKLWKERKNWNEYYFFNILNKQFGYNKKKLFSCWKEENKNIYNLWFEKNKIYYQKRYEEHKNLLWYVYTESSWISYNTPKQQDTYSSKTSIDDQDNFWDNQIIFSLDDEKQYFYIPNDPRRYLEISNEIEQHKHCILLYTNEITHNINKRNYIETNCSEEKMNLFFDKYYQKEEEESPSEYAERKLIEYWIDKHKKQWLLWKHRFLWNKEYDKYRYTNDPDYPNYKIQDYFYAWKQLHKSIWRNWINNEYTKYKKIVQDLDSWYDWLSKNNNAIIFETWAKNNIENWQEKKDLAMNYDLTNAYIYFFDKYDFDSWRINKPDEWNFWKKTIFEKVYIEKFKDNKFLKSYTPEFDLKIKIDELKYQTFNGIEIFNDNLALIEYKNKYGYINKNWEIVIKPQFHKATFFFNGVAAVMIDEYSQEKICNNNQFEYDNKWGLINKKGEYLKIPQYDNIIINNDIIIFEKKENTSIDTTNNTKHAKWGIMNHKLNIISPANYCYINILSNNLIIACVLDGQNRKWGLLDKYGKAITPFIYSCIYNSSKDYMIANKNSIFEEIYSGVFDFHYGEWGFIDSHGNEIEPFIPAYDIEEFIQNQDNYYIDIDFDIN